MIKRTKTEYGDGDRFTFTFFMLLVQCSVGCITGYICTHKNNFKQWSRVKILNPLKWTGTKFWKSTDNTPHSKFMAIAVLYLAAMFASNAALIYVPYPTQVSFFISQIYKTSKVHELKLGISKIM